MKTVQSHLEDFRAVGEKRLDVIKLFSRERISGEKSGESWGKEKTMPS